MMGSQSFVIFVRSMMTPSTRLKNFRQRVVGKSVPPKASSGELAKSGPDSDPIKERVALRVIAERSIKTT